MKDQLKATLKEALKARDQVKLDTVRGLLSAIQYEEMDKKVEPLPKDGIITLIQREVKKRREEIEYAEKANRPEAKEQLLVEISHLEGWLPKQLSASELEKIVVDLKNSNSGINVGLAMKTLKETYAGQYDGKLASDLVKKILG